MLLFSKARNKLACKAEKSFFKLLMINQINQKIFTPYNIH